MRRSSASRRAVTRKHLGSSARVAAVTMLVILIVYAGVGALLDDLVTSRLVGQVDRQLASQLRNAAIGKTQAPTPYGLGIYGEPIYIWKGTESGIATVLTKGAPTLGIGSWPEPEGPGAALSSVDLLGTHFRLMSMRHGRFWLIAGESLSEADHVRSVLVNAELVALPALIVVVFLGALAIGLRSAAPIELARQRQMEFTADASHELRTPLSVIDAEIQLAKSRPGSLEADPDLLERLSKESNRLRKIVEDLLFLARIDSAPPQPSGEPIDICSIGEASVARFRAVAESRGLSLEVIGSAQPVRVNAPPDWIEMLAGVLLDNACRYTPPGGRVRLTIGKAGSRAVLAVEDTGPGIPLEKRARLFDRFRRETTEPGGHGLGLAIADSVVRSTDGRWRISDAAGGGTRMEVSWPAR